MQISEEKYFPAYLSLIGKQIDSLVESYDFTGSHGDLEYITNASAVYSSNIERNSVDIKTFINYKLAPEKFKPQKEIQEIEDLISAYKYARANKLNETNLLACHKIFSETLIIKGSGGKYRNEKGGIFNLSGLVYLAIDGSFVKKIMEEFFNSLDTLINRNLNKAQVFYFASLAHLKFAHIHPFSEGNGRAARLIEKWFIAEKLGQDFWMIPSEKYYKEHRAKYYKNINLGANYYELNYDLCIPFLLMLPECLKK